MLCIKLLMRLLHHGNEQERAIDPEQQDGDLGGTLLSPVFALVNFVADAITRILGTVMTGEEGFSYKTIEPTNKQTLTKEDVYSLSTKSFITTNHYVVTYSPEEIFSGEIELLSIDFISGKDSDGNEITGDWASIRIVISQWYKVLRMIAIV